MILEGADGTFSGIPSVDMGGYQLVGAVGGADSLEESLAGFVIKDVVGRGLVHSGETLVEVLVGSDTVGIKFGGKGPDQDGVAAVYCHHDVLVAAPGTGVEAARVIGEDVHEGEFVKLDRVGRKGGALGSVLCWR